MTPTATQVQNAGKVLQHITFCHRRTAIRPANDTEAQAIAVVWAGLFATHNLDLPDLLAGVERRVHEGAIDAPEPAEVIRYARQIRRERAEREQANPTTRAIHEARIDDKIETFSGRFGLQLDR